MRRTRTPTGRAVWALLGAAIVSATPALAQPGDNAADKYKDYDEVITEEAVSDSGLFTTHIVGDTLYYEIEPEAFDRECVWVVSVDETTNGFSFAGWSSRDLVVRWERRGEDKVLLRNVRYNIRSSDEDDAISIAVEESSLAPVIRAFDVEAFGKNRSVVIDVTELFTRDVPELSVARTLGVGSMIPGRTFIEEVKSFPENIETEIMASYQLEGRAAQFSSGMTAVVHHSMVLLPDDPMQPREFDERVGYFNVDFTDFADDSTNEAMPKSFATRWRLEKKDPDAEMSDPVEPIVFYVAREVPDKWKPYVKKGIEDWLPAFKAAGFTNAIEGRYAPDPTDEPEWDAEDARISTIRWMASPVPNAQGPHVHDPRTGEILEADVRMFHNVIKLLRDWYFVQASPSDERAQQIPLPDEVMGELIRFVVAHEVGHSLGLPHNFKASSAYTIDQLRDPEWTRENGTAPSIMDYARFNYVAQPEDDAGLMPQVGPYDKFSIEWGYRQFDEDADVKAELEKLLKKQIDEPMYRWAGGLGGEPTDHTTQTEDLGDDAVEATRLGLRNLERVMGYLVEATSREGESYRVLEDMHGQVLGQWSREMGHVAKVVGSVEKVNLYYGDADQRYFPHDPDDQREAMDFLLDNAFTNFDAFIPDDVVMRLTGQGVAQSVLGQHRRLLFQLTSPNRINRMSEVAEMVGRGAYTPAEMMRDLSDGFFEDMLDGDDVSIYRRNLQRAYIDRLAGVLAEPAADSDMPALARAELVFLRDEIDDAAGRGDEIDEAHAADLLARINKALDDDEG